MEFNTTPVTNAIAAATGATTFTLIVRTTGRLWGGTEIHKVATEKAGFGHGRSDMDLDLMGEFKARPIAVLQQNGFESATGTLVEFSIVMDLDAHSTQWNAFESMAEAAAILAREMGGQVLLVDGTPVTEEILTFQKERISAIHKARRDESCPPSIKVDGVLVHRRSLISCFSISTPKRKGRQSAYNFFDVEPANYNRGRAAGMRLASELLDAISARNKTPYVGLDRLLRDALDPSLDNPLRRDGDKSKAHVAAGFIEALESMVVFFAGKARYASWLETRAAAYDRAATTYEEEVALQKVEFVERMRAGREKKKANRDAKRFAALVKTPAAGTKKTQRGTVAAIKASTQVPA